MKRKTMFGILGTIFVMSLIANLVCYLSRNDMNINSTGGSSFGSWNGEITLKFEGCLVWSDKDLGSQRIKQFWQVEALAFKGKSECRIIDATQFDSKVIISMPTSCELTSIDKENETATVIYKDASISVNRDRIVWTTSNKDESGGGELVPCYDRKLNWYPFSFD